MGKLSRRSAKLQSVEKGKPPLEFLSGSVCDHSVGLIPRRTSDCVGGVDKVCQQKSRDFDRVQISYIKQAHNQTTENYTVYCSPMEKVCLSVCTVALLAVLLAESAPPHAMRPDSLTTFFKKGSPASVSPSSAFTCDTCKGFFNVVRELFDRGVVWDDIAKLSVDVCDLLQIEDHTVCQGIVNLFKVRYLLLQQNELYYADFLMTNFHSAG